MSLSINPLPNLPPLPETEAEIMEWTKRLTAFLDNHLRSLGGDLASWSSQYLYDEVGGDGVYVPRFQVSDLTVGTCWMGNVGGEPEFHYQNSTPSVNVIISGSGIQLEYVTQFIMPCAQDGYGGGAYPGMVQYTGKLQNPTANPGWATSDTVPMTPPDDYLKIWYNNQAFSIPMWVTA